MPAQPLAKPLRAQLETTVKAARDIAEAAALAAIVQLGVGEAKAPEHLSDEQKHLRRRLRAHGRQLGDRKHANDSQETRRLVWETAYEHWHRMLFARFLAENHLLMWEPGAPVTLDECAELANDPDTSLGAKSGWELAGLLAARLLPQVFKARSPVLALNFAPEHQRDLEKRLAALPAEVFRASDSLGWVYQFWQAKRKDEVNASEVKIGADELPAVTQLFTEPYMVDFLLHNSLGAWWMTRHPDKPCPVEFTYLRQVPVAAASSRSSNQDDAATVAAASSRLSSQDDAATVAAASSRLTRQDGASTLYGYLRNDEPIANLAGNLPHWRQEGVSYFVTFRTADSLPQTKLEQWQQEREAWLKQHPKPHDEATRREYHDRFTARIEHWLDQGYGECLLGRPEYKSLVENALRYFDRQRYHLGEFVVMPNHVHVIVTPLPDFELSEILHSWKSFTSNKINRLAGKTGSFWQKESFDQIIRSPEHLERVTLYIRENPKVFVEAASSRLTRQDGAATVAAASSRSSSQDDAATEQAARSRFYPAAGGFEGWPDSLAEFTLLDPCCGSGHFLVAAFLLLVPMRMAAEGLDARAAVDAVLRDNLHGLELDARCVELAAFALALAAWRYPDENGEALGYRELPKLNLACCGLAVAGQETDWLALAGEDERVRRGMKALYDAFQDAPLLGSLIDPQRAVPGDLLTADFSELAPLLTEALAKESEVFVETASSRLQRQDAAATTQEELLETAIAAQGLAEAARLLAQRYHLVVTNVPYLTRGKQSDRLKKFCEIHYKNAKNDLANVFLDRCLELSKKRGVVQIVMPQNWLFLTSYKKQREKLLKQENWNLLARLGPGAFETIAGEVVNVILLTLTRAKHPSDFLLQLF